MMLVPMKFFDYLLLDLTYLLQNSLNFVNPSFLSPVGVPVNEFLSYLFMANEFLKFCNIREYENI